MNEQETDPAKVSTRRKLGFYTLGSLECELGLPQRTASEWKHPSFLYRWYVLGYLQKKKEVHRGHEG